MADLKDADWLQELASRRDRALVPRYEDRSGRNLWAASVVRTFPGTRVLNLGGGGKRHLQSHLGSGWQVHEVDISGDCDTCLNLDTVDRLPFQDATFDTCCAFEVLEHLERFHLICEEMFRVCRSMVLLSLPNAAVEIVPILRNIRNYSDPLQNGVYSKFYGMPLAVPGDRHRWWLTVEDIIRYFVWFESRHVCRVTFFIPDDAHTLKRRLFRIVMGERLYLTLCCSSVWVKIEK